MQHSEGFLAIVNAARTGVSEIDLDQACERLSKNPDTILMDVREDIEWSNGHAAEAVHLGKGILERDIESVVPEKGTEVIMYCGGGYRSVLTAEVAQRMGYTRMSTRSSADTRHSWLPNGRWKTGTDRLAKRLASFTSCG